MEEKKKAKTSQIDLLEKHGTPLSYVRFQTPVAPYENAEPVFEFRINPGTKYSVDRITLSERGIIWRCREERGVTPDANYVWGRCVHSAE